MLVRTYRGSEKWIPGIIHSPTRPLSYEVRVGPDSIWRRHIDQLLDIDTGKPLVFNQKPDPVPQFVPDTSEQMTPSTAVPEPTSPTPTTTNTKSRDEQLPVDPEPATEPPSNQRRYPLRQRRPPDRLYL